MKIISVKFACLFVTILCANALAQDVVPNSAPPLKDDKQVEQPAKAEDIQKVEAETKPAEPIKAESAPVAGEKNAENYFGLSAALGLPHPLNIGLDYIHSSKIFSVGLAAGSFSLKQDGAEIGIGSSDVALRWHPFMGSFYVGALLGQQKSFLSNLE